MTDPTSDPTEAPMPACPVGRLPTDREDLTLYELAEALDNGLLEIGLGEIFTMQASYLGVPISISSPSAEEGWRLFFARLESIRRDKEGMATV